MPPSGSSVILFPAHSRTLDRAFSSGGERFPDTEEVRSSNLLTPTKCSQLRGFASELFCFTPPSQEGVAAPKAASTAPTTTPTKPKVAQTTPESAQIGPEWASQPYPDDPRKSKVNGFPRSERVKTNPRSIDTFRLPFPAVLMPEFCDFTAEKCGCFRGPKTAVDFAEKY